MSIADIDHFKIFSCYVSVSVTVIIVCITISQFVKQTGKGRLDG